MRLINRREAPLVEKALLVPRRWALPRWKREAPPVEKALLVPRRRALPRWRRREPSQGRAIPGAELRGIHAAPGGAKEPAPALVSKARARRVFRPLLSKCRQKKRHRREAVKERTPVLAVPRRPPPSNASERRASPWPVPPVGSSLPVVPSVPRVSLLRVGRLCGVRSMRLCVRCRVGGSCLWPRAAVLPRWRVCSAWPVVGVSAGRRWRVVRGLRRGRCSSRAIAHSGLRRACLRHSFSSSGGWCHSPFVSGRSCSGAERPRGAASGEKPGAERSLDLQGFLN